MLTLQRSPALPAPTSTRETTKRDQVSSPAVPAERVREMLREIAFILHATRVVGRVEEGGAAKE